MINALHHRTTCPQTCAHSILQCIHCLMCYISRQVGRKERKVGPYGGCYLHSDGSVLVSRPGVRIWLADGEGNVCPNRGREEKERGVL